MLTVDQLREHVTTALSDDALGRLLDAAYEAIDAYAGAGGDDDYPVSLTEVITAGPGDIFMLSRPAESITAIEDRDTDLAEDDYELIGGQMVRRLRDGTHAASRWNWRVTVTYTPLSMAAERDRVAIALVQQDIDSSPGVQSERLGDHSITYAADSDYATSRAAILSSLGGHFFAA